MKTVQVESLHIYPVKSLRGLELDEALLTAKGLSHDRSFMLVRPDGRFVTQREIHALALIETGISDDELTLSRAGNETISVPLASADGPVICSRVWRDDCEVVDCGDTVAEWLTHAADAGTELRLVRMAKGFTRRHHDSRRFDENASTLFADAAPFLVANTASLDRLNGELQARGLAPVPMNRFRPNIVVSGIDAFSEHESAGLRHDQCELRFHDPCERCIVTTINQSTGDRDGGNQPFDTLKDINPVPGKPPAPAFGQNASLAAGAGGRLKVGQILNVLLLSVALAVVNSAIAQESADGNADWTLHPGTGRKRCGFTDTG